MLNDLFRGMDDDERGMLRWVFVMVAGALGVFAAVVLIVTGGVWLMVKAFG